jgi:hypothetical protein
MGRSGYTQAAIARSAVIFSAIANVPNGFSTSNITRTLKFNPSTNIRFALIKGNTLDAVKAGTASSADIVISPKIKNPSH